MDQLFIRHKIAQFLNDYFEILNFNNLNCEILNNIMMFMIFF
jgi:hypothetical protein